jgi:hypothetical protein
MAVGDNRFTELGLNPKAVFLIYPHNSSFLNGKYQTPNFFAPWEDTFAALGGFLTTWFVLLVTFMGLILPIPSYFAAATVNPKSVQYDPGRHAVSNLALFLGICLVCIPILVLIIRSWQLGNRFVKAWPTASLIAGQVIMCHGKNFSRSSRNYYYRVTLTYSYISRVTGQLVIMKEIAKRNDLLYCRLPKPGTPVLIVSFQEPIKSTNPFRDKYFQEFVL